jgi:GntR family transcriptional regulator, transcriptional repressor for pyruvate dehydrogenase complex
MARARQKTESNGKQVGRRNLVSATADALRHMVQAGEVPVGGKLPSTVVLTERFNVSRTVVREAIAALQADGLLESRQGAGVFVIAERPAQTFGFASAEPSRISSMIELLEIRTALEVEAAGLASQRHSPAQAEAIYEACRDIDTLIDDGQPTSQADLQFHLTIADATNNGRFREFLEMMGQSLIPRRVFQPGADGEGVPRNYLQQIQKEHRAIADAIARQDDEAAREAMRTHLRGSQARYRGLLPK